MNESETTSTGGTEPPIRKRGINLLGLIALVISSSIGSGVFALSTDVSAAAAPGPALIAWLITGFGFMCLATTFGRLSVIRPDLDGIVAYAREGFGPFVGFVSGWGYWLSIWIGNVAFGVMLVTAIGYFFPPFAGELGIPGVIFISVLNWFIILLVNRGVEEASVLNAIVMICKLVPIFAFIATMLLVFDFKVFTADFWGTLAANLDPSSSGGSIPSQIINCFMVMMWVFVGMEGASVLGHRAERKSDVGRATVLGCTALVIIYVAASILPYGYLPREELISIGSPSMPYIFSHVVGPWGGAFISAGLIISIFGAWLSYTILASEAMHGMAQMKLLPRSFSRLNDHGAPSVCLLTTGAMIQVLSIVMLFSEAAYQFAYSLCTASIVISWALAAAYMAKLGLGDKAREVRRVDIALS
ncbi:MAG: basic amino acid/polyamine antiporter, partial [Collinsella sp.]|nr:basic amino acid/polyamine antiporter [Collinsella sp.]